MLDSSRKLRKSVGLIDICRDTVDRADRLQTRQLRIAGSQTKLGEVGFSSVVDANQFLCEIRGLAVTYALRDGTRVRAVDDLSLAIRSAEVVGILGESGCGKSTLAGAILQILPAHAHWEQGSVVFRGSDLSKMTESELREIRGRDITLIPQDPALDLESGDERRLSNCRGAAGASQVGAQTNAGREFWSCSARLGSIVRRRFRSVPASAKRRPDDNVLQLRRAISCRPALVIADEPTSKLDAPLRAEIIALLARIRREHGVTIVLISHDPAVFAGFADRIAVMYAGRIVEVGTTAPDFSAALASLFAGSGRTRKVGGDCFRVRRPGPLCGDRWRLARSFADCLRDAGFTRAARNGWMFAPSAIRKLSCPSRHDR